MIYEYVCRKCEHGFDVVKPVADLDRVEACPSCGVELTERIFSPRIYFNNAKVSNAEFNMGLGCVTTSKRHRDEIAKQQGLIELGNETNETLHRETVVKKEKERDKFWKDL